MTFPCRVEKAFRAWKHKLPSGSYFSCQALTMFIVVVLVQNFAIIFFLIELEVLKIEKMWQ